MRVRPKRVSRGLFVPVCLLLGACAGGGAGHYGATDAGRGSPASLDLAEIEDNPNRMTGIAARDVEALLGEPDFVRHEKPAEVWQYYGRDCVLDLFLYGDGDRRSVSYVDLRGKNSSGVPDRRCLSSLFEKGRRPSS